MLGLAKSIILGSRMSNLLLTINKPEPCNVTGTQCQVRSKTWCMIILGSTYFLTFPTQNLREDIYLSHWVVFFKWRYINFRYILEDMVDAFTQCTITNILLISSENEMNLKHIFLPADHPRSVEVLLNKFGILGKTQKLSSFYTWNVRKNHLLTAEHIGKPTVPRPGNKKNQNHRNINCIS